MIRWRFLTKNFKVEWITTPATFDETYMDPEDVKEIKAKIKSGEFKCFDSEIRVKLRTGEVLAQVYLGNSVYSNPADFRDHFGMRGKNYGSYFSDMVKEAIEKARGGFDEIKQVALVQCEILSKIKLRGGVQ